MKKILIVLAAIALTGCSNLKFQWAASYQTDNLAADLERARAERQK
jgi:hypothetical protein